VEKNKHHRPDRHIYKASGILLDIVQQAKILIIQQVTSPSKVSNVLAPVRSTSKSNMDDNGIKKQAIMNS
jgi:hypothetical protein